LGEVSLQPATGGIFKVHLYDEEPGPTEEDEATIEEYLLWDRKAEGGFPGMRASFVLQVEHITSSKACLKETL
jgi:predicted Rdx family selenoprotein